MDQALRQFVLDAMDKCLKQSSGRATPEDVHAFVLKKLAGTSFTERPSDHDIVVLAVKDPRFRLGAITIIEYAGQGA